MLEHILFSPTEGYAYLLWVMPEAATAEKGRKMDTFRENAKADFIVMELENNYVNTVKRITSQVFSYLPPLFKS